MGRLLTQEYGREIKVGNNTGDLRPYDNRGGHRGEGPMIWAVVSLVLGVLAYAVSWALGWIVAGFTGDHDAAAK